MFLTELHAHTSEVSKCAHQTAEQVADRYLREGYRTLVVSNHFTTGSLGACSGSWEEKIDFYVSPWKKMKEYVGGKMNVLLGCELRFDENHNDYLLFGVTEDFLRAHPEICSLNPKSFAPIARENGVLFVQAHPFRNGMKMVDPNDLDGIEVFNGHAGHDSKNDLALLYCKKYGKIPTSGSDFHDADSETSGGILTEMPIESMEQLKAILESGDYNLYCTGTASKRDGIVTMKAKDAPTRRF